MQEMVSGKFLAVEKPEVTFNEAADSFLAYSEARRKSHKNDIQMVERLKAYFGERPLRSLTPDIVECFLTQRKKAGNQASNQGRNGKALSNATLNRDLGTLKAIVNRAVLNDLIEKNPIQRVRPFREESRDRTLTPEEYEELLTHCAPRLSAIVQLAYWTGMRKGEILGLRWDQVDFQNKVVNLEAADTKTQEKREVPLTEGLLDLLKRTPKTLGSPYVFTHRGKRIQSVKTAFLRACRMVGIGNFKFHDLRHCAVTRSVILLGAMRPASFPYGGGQDGPHPAHFFKRSRNNIHHRRTVLLPCWSWRACARRRPASSQQLPAADYTPVTSSQLQAVNSDGSSYFATIHPTSLPYPIQYIGVVANNPADMEPLYDTSVSPSNGQFQVSSRRCPAGPMAATPWRRRAISAARRCTSGKPSRGTRLRTSPTPNGSRNLTFLGALDADYRRRCPGPGRRPRLGVQRQVQHQRAALEHDQLSGVWLFDPGHRPDHARGRRHQPLGPGRAGRHSDLRPDDGDRLRALQGQPGPL